MELPPPCRGNNRISILLSCRVHSELSMAALAAEFCHTPVQACVKAANPLSPVLFVIANGCTEAACKAAPGQPLPLHAA